MSELIEMVANASFLMFLLGAVGFDFFPWLQKRIIQCNPKVFSVVCMILTYIGLEFFFQ